MTVYPEAIMRKRIKSLKLNNKGSGIVTVLIAVVFLTLMGSLLLMLAFTGFEMKSSDRAGKQNTYDASTAMDEIRVGIQEAVSKSVEDSYAYALNRYSEKGADIQSRFAQNFISSFEKSEIKGEKLIEKKDASSFLSYNLNALNGMIVNCRDGAAAVTTPEEKAEVVIDADNLKIVFKNVAVSYTNKGRTTTVSADINVAIPDIGYSLSQFTVSGVPSFTAIVGGNLKQDGTAASVTQISGGAYMNNLELKSNSRLVLNDGIFVCRNNADISGSYNTVGEEGVVEGRMVVSAESTFWAKNIILRDLSAASFLGNTYIENDLDLAGGGSSVTLSGTYTGFGTGGEDGKDASKSSSIIVNGKNNKINLNGLSNLVLAGFGFVGESPIAASSEAYAPGGSLVQGNTNIKMGESLTVRENQKVYLVPDGYLNYVVRSGDIQNKTPSTNPDIFPGTDSFVKEEDGTYSINMGGKEYTVTLDTTKPLWTIDGKALNFASYNAQLKPVCMVVSNQLVVYYFISFKNSPDGKTTADENANRYFKDYVLANTVQLNKYVSKYVTVSESQVASQTMGNFFVGSGDLTFRDYLSNSQSAAIRANSAQYEKYFSNMCQTLSYNESSSNPNDNPFTYYINSEKITDELDGVQEFKDESGTTVALVVDGNYTYDETSSGDIHLIIATGTVSVKKNYEGLIFCNGDLNLDADSSLSANSKEVEKSYAGEAKIGGEDRRIGDYFKIPIGESNNWGESSESGSGKSVASLVTYSNWKKN